MVGWQDETTNVLHADPVGRRIIKEVGLFGRLEDWKTGGKEERMAG